MTEEEAFWEALRQMKEEEAKSPGAAKEYLRKMQEEDRQRQTPSASPPAADANRGQTPPSTPASASPQPQPQPQKSLLQKGIDLWKSAGVGIAKAGFETKDFLAGEPKESEKSDIRRGIEQRGRELAGESTANAITTGITQFATGLLGAGKLMAPLKAAKWMAEGGKVAETGYEIAKGALAGSVVLDPHEDRLSNLVQQYPALRNPVTEYLAADPEDSAAEGRFKNALEGMGLDIAMIGVLGTAVRGYRYLRNGDEKAATKELAKLEKAPEVNPDPAATPQPQSPVSGRPQTLAEDASSPQPPSEARTESTAPDGTTTPAAPETPLSESPRPEEKRMEFEERAAALEYDGGLTREEAERQAAAETGYKPNASGQAVESHLAASATDGTTTTAANAEMPLSDSPRVKEGGLNITPEQVDAILQSTRADREAIRKYGSREAAAEAGQITRQGPSPIPWQKIRSTEDVATLWGNTARVLKDQMDEAKGGAVLSDAKVNSMVEARAELFGEDPALVLGQIRKAGHAAKDMVANMEAGYLIGSRMMEDTYAMAFRMANGMETDAAKAGEELKNRLLASADFMAASRSMSSNSGRALRRMRGQFHFTPELLEKVKTMDGAEIARLIYQTKGDPKLLAQTVNPTFLRRVLNEVNFSLTNSLLWLYPTHVVNLTSNLYMLAGRPTEKLLGAIAMGPQEGGNILRQQAVQEYGATVAALGDAWENAKDAFLRGDSILSPHNTEFFQGGVTQQPLPWKPAKSIMDLAENAWKAANYRNIVGLPTRTLGAVDEFFKTLRYRAYVQGQAASRAYSMGITGADFRRYVEEELEKAIDPATGQALDSKALQDAQTTTFQNELLAGTAGATIQQARNRHPVLTLILPFVKTPINVLRYGWKMTPGLNMLQREFRDAIQGKQGQEAAAHAIGQMILGSTFMGIAATLALNGKITGAGPKDAKLQAELKATGWQPYSYVMEDGHGGKRYIPMGRMDPTGMAFGMVATLVDMLRHDPDNGQAEVGIGALGLALAKNFTDRSFLQNMHQALQALTDPERGGEKWLGGIAGNAIPLSSALKGANPDPYLRDARGFIETMLKNVPGYSETLPPTRDVFGEPVWRRIGITTKGDEDEVEAENNRMMLETGKGIHKPDPDMSGVDLRDITLQHGKNAGRNAYDRFQELAGHIPGRRSLKQELARLIRNHSYLDMPDGDSDVKGTRLNALGKITQQYRDLAKRYFLQENPELHPLLVARQKAARGAWIENRQKRLHPTPGAKAILSALQP